LKKNERSSDQHIFLLMRTTYLAELEPTGLNTHTISDTWCCHWL